MVTVGGRPSPSCPCSASPSRCAGADLKDGLGSVALDVVAIGDDLQHAVPHLLTDVVAPRCG